MEGGGKGRVKCKIDVQERKGSGRRKNVEMYGCRWTKRSISIEGR